METLKLINSVIAVVFFLCYTYQFCYIPVVWLMRAKPHSEPRPHRFAILICARNEEAVIGDLIASIHAQTYNPALLSVFVLADNCTDNTAATAENCGAVVYERHDSERIGKGYALQALILHLEQDYPAGFDGYFVFDADNILSPDYIEQMNRTFSDGHDIITSYRNSKNYGDNWISAGYALWFLRESRYLNQARFLLGTSCAVSGTGFLFSRKILREMGPWPFHLLTEDIEFSVHQILAGHKIAFCPTAVLYDEQPTSFRQSWRQRSRWSRGYLQVFQRYGKRLMAGILRGHWGCFDMAMAIMPAFLLSAAGIVCTVLLAVTGAVQGGGFPMALRAVGTMLGGMYLTLFLIGAITTATEWRQIRTTTAKKLRYTLTFPLFMFTYLPIAVSSLFCKAEWRPIQHRICAAQIGERCKEEALPF
ncbi:MAG: glycosyltransferase family 2 protein [Clostridiales bacterium]|nr:glycosyltransferase family 2 protein [Candidatus Cacconaster stercorequi]